MTVTTAINHKTDECSLHGCFCHVAQGLATTETETPFDREWELAPTVATRYMEREVAEYWFLRGMRAERDCATESANQDLRKLVELVRS